MKILIFVRIFFNKIQIEFLIIYNILISFIYYLNFSFFKQIIKNIIIIIINIIIIIIIINYINVTINKKIMYVII